MNEIIFISFKMEITEQEAMKETFGDSSSYVMNILETEPTSESDHREELAILAASGHCKEMIGVELSQEQMKRLSKKMLRNILNVTRSCCLQKLVMQ